MPDFYTLWTDTGLTQIGDAALAAPFNITTAVVGDGNGSDVIPNRGQTALANTVWSGPVTSKTRSKADPNTIVFEFAIPAGDGPFFIREVGLADADGNLCITGNWPVTEKPVAADGAVRDMVLRVPVHFENADVVNLTVDPLVLASRAELAAHMAMELDPTDTDDTRDRHPSNAQAKVWQDHAQSHHVTHFGGQRLIDNPGMIGGSCTQHPGYGTDLNNILKAGRWDYDANDSNKPNEPFGVGVVDVFHDEIEGRLTQVVVSTVKAEMFIRNSTDGGATWTEWVNLTAQMTEPLVKSIIIASRVGVNVNLDYVPSPEEMAEECMFQRNGDQLLVADYPKLYSKIGRNFTPPGVASPYFWLPDDRGLFPRYMDSGAGRMPDAATRLARPDGTAGDRPGTTELSQNLQHGHSLIISGDFSGNTERRGGFILDEDYCVTYGENTGAASKDAPGKPLGGSGGSESRPPNYLKWGGIYYDA